MKIKKWISTLALIFLLAGGGVVPNFDANVATTTGWSQTGGHWYYTKTDGALQTGWLYSGGKWYYFNSNGIMQTGWVHIGSKWYYFESSGAMKIGWVYTGGKWYYLNPSGDMATGWKTIDGKQYYFYASGYMAANTTVSGKRIGSSGAVIQVTANPTNYSTSQTSAVRIISIISPAARNSTETVTAKVSPNSMAYISVHYKSGDSKAKGLEPKRSDSYGNVSWSWHVGGNTTLGVVTVTVSCNGYSSNTQFTVIH